MLLVNIAVKSLLLGVLDKAVLVRNLQARIANSRYARISMHYAINIEPVDFWSRTDYENARNSRVRREINDQVPCIVDTIHQSIHHIE